MKRGLTLLTSGALLWGVAATCAFAQKGTGEPAGVARQGLKPKVVSLSGEVLAVETGPCEKTTGRADHGSHLLLRTPNGKTLNVHLGPTAAVNDMIKRLPVGKKVTVGAFHTARMPSGHYVAQSLVVDGITIRLRDQQLRPLWAGAGGVSRAYSGPRYGRGTRHGSPWRNGPGYGPGRGRGRGWGRR